MLEGTITGVSSQNWLQTRKYFKRRLTTVICFHPQLIVGETVRLHRGKSFKLGCPFYIAFTAIKDQPGWYHCSGINAEHLCMPDIYTVDRYYKYRMRDPAIQEDAIIMMQNGIRAGQVANTLQDKHKIPVRPTDVHCVMQTRRDNLKSLSDVGIQASETRRLLDGSINTTINIVSNSRKIRKSWSAFCTGIRETLNYVVCFVRYLQGRGC